MAKFFSTSLHNVTPKFFADASSEGERARSQFQDLTFIFFKNLLFWGSIALSLYALYFLFFSG